MAADLPAGPLAAADRPADIPRTFLSDPEPEQDPRSVSVDGFRLLPLGDLSSPGGSWTVHPKAVLGAAWDANPLTVERGARADSQLRLSAGAEIRSAGREALRLELDGMLRMRRYADTPQRNGSSGETTARLMHDGDAGLASVEASFIRAIDPLYQVWRDDWRGTAAFARELRRWRWRAEATAAATSFREATPFFGEDARDSTRLGLGLSAVALAGAGSAVGGEIALEDLRRDGSSPANPHRAATLLMRWRHGLGDRTAADLRLGGTIRLHEADTRDDAANDDRVAAAPVANLRLDWAAETRSTASLILSTGLVDGITATSNAARLDEAVLQGRLRLADRLDLVGRLRLSRYECLAPEISGSTETAIDRHARGGFEYRLRDGLGLRTWAELQRRTSTTGPDYDRVLLALELAVVL